MSSDNTWKKEAVALSKTPRFRGKPLSLATHLNRPWRLVVEALAEAKVVNRESYVMRGDHGFMDYDD